jgi:hypothetical protein
LLCQPLAEQLRRAEHEVGPDGMRSPARFV